MTITTWKGSRTPIALGALAAFWVLEPGTADGEYLFLKGGVAGYMQTHYELVELSRGPHWGN